MFQGLELEEVGVLVDWVRRKIEGDSWFTWWFKRLFSNEDTYAFDRSEP